VLFGASLVAQPWIDFLKSPILSEDDRGSMMFSYVDRHLPTIEIPGSKDEWQRRRAALRKAILELVGLSDLERRGPVRWTSRGQIERDGYTIEKLLFESYPGMMVPAIVYVPKALRGRAPAMISIPGHVYCEGKASESTQARAVHLARLGFIAMTYDYIDTGERNTGADACGSMPYGGANDHGLTRFSYTAGTPTGLEILDAVRAIDYLYTRPDVDAERLGFTGESGGSNSTYWTAALDERVKLAVPVCSVTTFDYWIRNNRNWDWHQRPAGMRRIADIPTLLALIAPRPLLVIGSLRGTDSEEFPFDQTELAVDQARRAYDLYGAGRNLELWESKTAHGYQQDKRERMYAFVSDHFLQHQPTPLHESAFLLEPTGQLACGLEGTNRTVAGIYSEWLDHTVQVPSLPAGRAFAEQFQVDLRGRLQTLLGIDETVSPPRTSVQLVTSRGNVVVRRLIVEPEDGIRLPVFEIVPRTRPLAGMVVIPGKSERSPEDLSPLLSAALGVALVDLRGTGEIYSGGRRTDNWAWFMGRPWPGMWVRDISAVIKVVSNQHAGVPVGVIGVGEFSKAVIYAAALSPAISKYAVRLEQPTYRAEAMAGGLSDVPRILSLADLPVIVALSAPRHCRIEYPPNAAQEFGNAYAWPRKFCIGAFGAESVDLQPSPGVDWTALADWLSRTSR
jgi:acetyl esterase/lipase